jgi:hypothetical protein
MALRRQVAKANYPHPIFVVDKIISHFVAKTLACNDSLRKSTRRGIMFKNWCDEWNQASDETSRKFTIYPLASENG